MTSANVIEYIIEHDSKTVGTFRKNVLCKLPDYSELLKYEPLSEHKITPFGYDEEDAYWEDDAVNLEEFLRDMINSNETIEERFS